MLTEENTICYPLTPLYRPAKQENDVTHSLCCLRCLPLGIKILEAGDQVQEPLHCRAGKQLTELVMKQHVSQGLPFMKGLFKNQDKQKAAHDPSSVPPPAQRPFPREAKAAGKGPMVL